jgi:hypothetical protein
LVFFFGFLTISFSSIGYAQQVMIGLRGGVNLANEDYVGSPSGGTISARTLFLAGVQIDYPISNSWALSIQLLYDQKGAHADKYYFTTEESPDINYGTGDWSTTYLEIPLLVKVSFGNDAIRPYLFAGPSIGYLLSSTVRLQATGGMSIPNELGVTYQVDTTLSTTDYTNKIDVSVVAGAGISWKLVQGSEFFLDASYAFGLTSSNQESDVSIYSRDIRLAAGVLFPLN